jgi:hypothetical protein
MNYGQLASLGIEKGKPFNPDSRMQGILLRAAEIANEQMRVQSFADRTPERMAWPNRMWEWATLRPENGTFDLPTAKDLAARKKWFYQAQIESPAMFRRTAGAARSIGSEPATPPVPSSTAARSTSSLFRNPFPQSSSGPSQSTILTRAAKSSPTRARQRSAPSSS